MQIRKKWLPLLIYGICCIFFILGIIHSKGYAQDIIHTELNKNWQFRKVGDLKYFTAYVPGTVHTDLYKNQIISDPYYGCNEQKQQWIENENWEYRLSFSLPDSIYNRNHINLVFEGIDTYATICLNDKQILCTDNMFRTWEADIKPYLNKGNNELKVIFESAVKKGKKMAETMKYVLPGEEKVFTRKAQYQYGWDWGPRFVTCGIFKPVYIESWKDAKIENIQVIQLSLNKNLADLSILFRVNADKNDEFTFFVNENNTNTRYIEKKLSLAKGLNTVNLEFQIPNPKFWWSNGLGEAYLYHFYCGISKNYKTLDYKIINTGLRNIEIVQEKDSIGKSFYVKLNGLPVFMKGANFIPADNFISRIDSSKYAGIINNAVEANMNMLRVWGGGIYENDLFYDLCDRKGILVWQDFMFACAMYPGDTAFIGNVYSEAVDVVERLRNHPCIALWCGNNEIDEGWHNWGWQKQYNYSAADSATIWNNYCKIFHYTLPEVISKYDENRFYWPSSPSIGWGRKESMLQGDSHYWGIWWGMEPFEVYIKKTGRFMSEYGFQGMPPYTTFLRFAPPDSLTFSSDMVKNHQKHPVGYQTIRTYMERDYKIPADFKDYIYVSQLLQAEGMKTAIEAHRRAKPVCMGTLYWQLNDCWQVTSWSSTDYYNKWKALHYFVKKLYEDVLISVNKEGDNYKIYLISDKTDDIKGNLSVTIEDFYGKILFKSQIPAVVGKNSSKIFYSIKEDELKKLNKKQIYLNCSFSTDSSNKTYSSIYYFLKTKELILEKPDIKINQLNDSNFEITTNVLAKNVYLYVEGKDIKFSDNYFDLLPGEKKIIHIDSKGIINLLKVKTLADCYPPTDKKSKP